MSSLKFEIFFRAAMTPKIQGTETSHTHNGRVFYVHECGEDLLITKYSIANKHIILDSSRGFDAIQVDDSDNSKYLELLEYEPQTENEITFKRHLKEALKRKLTTFYVPVYDPSISNNGKLQFVANENPAIGLTDYQLEKLGKKNNMDIACRSEYILLISTLMLRVLADGYEKDLVWNIFCNDSSILGNYKKDSDENPEISKTGTLPFYGKCDLANTYKVIRNDHSLLGFSLGLETASGSYMDKSDLMPVAGIRTFYEVSDIHKKGTALYIYRKTI